MRLSRQAAARAALCRTAVSPARSSRRVSAPDCCIPCSGARPTSAPRRPTQRRPPSPLVHDSVLEARARTRSNPWRPSLSRNHSIPSSLSRGSESFGIDRHGRLADTACWRHCHASIKSRQRSPTGDERHNTSKSGPSRPTASMRVSSPPGRDHRLRVGRHRHQAMRTASLDAVASPAAPGRALAPRVSPFRQ